MKTQPIAILNNLPILNNPIPADMTDEQWEQWEQQIDEAASQMLLAILDRKANN